MRQFVGLVVCVQQLVAVTQSNLQPHKHSGSALFIPSSIFSTSIFLKLSVVEVKFSISVSEFDHFGKSECVFNLFRPELG